MKTQVKIMKLTQRNNGFEFLKYQAEQGNMEAQYKLGLYYEWGRGVQQDYTEAVNWFAKAAMQGNRDAQDRLDELAV